VNGRTNVFWEGMIIMVRAGPSFQSITCGGNSDSEECLCKDKVADIMARYYARIGESTGVGSVRALVTSEKQVKDDVYLGDDISGAIGTQDQPDAIALLLDKKRRADCESLVAINESRLKMQKTSVALEKLRKDLKKLEVGGEFLRAVRNNLDEMDRNFWSWLL